MSKQSQANTIVKAGVAAGLDRQTMIDEICAQTGAGPGYAGTLYAAGRRAANGPVTNARKPQAGGKMTSFTNPNLDLLRTEMDAALKAIGDKYGITMDTGNIRYDVDRTNFNTSIKVRLGDGGVADVAANNRREWDKYAPRFGLKSTDFGKTFVSNGQTFTLSGVKPRGKKYNVLAKNPAGKCYKFSGQRVAGLLK